MVSQIFTAVAAIFALLSQSVFGYSHTGAPNVINRWMHPPNPTFSLEARQAVTPLNATFEQLIDHKNPNLGTFSQFYYYSTEYWRGPGSPVIFFTPGEVNVTGYNSYMTQSRTSGVIAKELGAAVIVMEHRYWGQSSPFANLSTANLQYLTLENSIADFVHFAKTAELPFDTNGASLADKVPWLFIGGSYSGALSAWIESVSPGTFWAYYSSSAPVQSMDYWEYFVPVQQGMPKNCSLDVSRVIDYVDRIGVSGTEAEKKALQTRFGLGELEHYDDFASALENGPWLWQGNQFYANSGFFQFCDAVEGVSSLNSTLPGPDGVGTEKAVAGYAKWFNETMLPDFCASYGYSEWQRTYSVGCLDTYDPTSPYFTDWSLGNQFDRQWVWMTCNEPFGYWQDAAPLYRPSIVSRFVTQEYWTRQCDLFFPEEDGYVNGIAAGRTYDDVNRYTGGWYINDTTRLLYVNGDFDPWREAGVSSDFRPGGKLVSTEEVPVNIVPGGFHTSDLVTRNGAVNPAVKAVIDSGVSIIVRWMAEWPGPKLEGL